METIKSARFHIRHRGTIKKMVKLAFSNNDASLYFFPCGQKGHFFYGNEILAADEIEKVFDYKTQYEGTGYAKLSFHESGQVHVVCPDSPRTNPLRTSPLKDWRGKHMATVTSDIKALSKQNGLLREHGSRKDIVIDVADEVKSVRLSFYCNGKSPIFIDDPINGFIVMKRTSTTSPIYVGYKVFAQKALDESEDGCSVVIIAGWKAFAEINQKEDFVFIYSE